MHLMRVCLVASVLAIVWMVIGQGASAQDECEVQAYQSAISAGERTGIVLIEVKVQRFDSDELALEGLKSEMEGVYFDVFNQVGLDHSDDDRAVELNAYEIGALIWGANPVGYGSISGYVEDQVMYAFFIVHQAKKGGMLNTSHYSWDLIEAVRENNNQYSEVILEDSLFNGTWKEIEEKVFSCK